MRAVGEPLVIEELETSPLRADEVRVETRAVGVCHSDLHVLDGHMIRPLPCVLGHEASGVVTEVGEAVTNVAAGELVVACLVVHCGVCRWCRRGSFALCADKAATARGPGEMSRLVDAGGRPVVQFTNIAALAEEMVVHHSAVTAVRADMPPEAAALLGCAVATAYGAVENIAGVRPGESAVVVGAGGVGLNLVAASVAAGASPVIAVDLDGDRLALARDVAGATHTVDGADHRAVRRAVADLTGGGADHVFEAVGRTALLAAALDLVADGGAAYAVGLLTDGAEVAVPVAHLHSAKRIVGVRLGNIDPRRDIAALADRYAAGELPLDALITRRVPLDGVNDAFDALRDTDGARTVVVF